VPADLHHLERRLAEGEDPEAWAELATWMARTGQRPVWLGEPGMATRVVERVRERPGDLSLARLLEAVLPVRVCEGGEGGELPDLELTDSGDRLSWSPEHKGWAARRPMTLEFVRSRRGGRSASPYSAGTEWSLRWLECAAVAQGLTDEARAAGRLDPAWELRLPRIKTHPHRFPPERRRLVLGKGRRKQPGTPGLSFERAYLGTTSSLIRRYLRFFRDGRVHGATGGTQDRRRFAAEFLRGGSNWVNWRGRYQLEGRELHFELRQGGGALAFDGFVGDDRNLYLRCVSHITGHVSATVYRLV